MSGIALNYQLNILAARKLFNRFQKADTAPLMDDIGQYLVNATLGRIDKEETPDGEKWEPSYRAEREGGKTLQDSGRLRDSYTHNVLSDVSVEIGSNLLYAAIHHEGGTITAKDGGNLKFKIGNQWVQKKSVEMPARPALGISTEDENEIHAITEDFLQELISGH